MGIRSYMRGLFRKTVKGGVGVKSNADDFGGATYILKNRQHKFHRTEGGRGGGKTLAL